MPVKSADKSKGALRKKTKASVNKRQAGLVLDCQKLSERLKELEIRYQVALENSKQLLYDLDLTTGRIVWSGNILGVTGYQSAEFADCDVAKWEKLIHPDDRRQAADLLAKAIKSRSKYRVEYRFRRKNGSYAFIDDQGVLAGKNRLVGTMNDVSSLKEKITELERMNDLMVGRELRMVELKERIKMLEGKSAATAKPKRRPWSDKFKEAVEMEEDVIWQLKDSYMRAIDESGLGFLKKRRAKTLINQLIRESIGHRQKINSLINHGKDKK